MTTTRGDRSRTWLARLRRAWMITGGMAGTIFVIWSVLAYRATPEAHASLASTPTVDVSTHDGYWRFQPQQRASVGLLFFPGALVDPTAYAPLVRAVAERGYMAVLVQVPRRGAFGGAESAELVQRYTRAVRDTAEGGGSTRWVLAGHSRGGVISSNVARAQSPWIAGLVLIGTSHPRDFSLAHLQIPVTQIFGTRDTIADVDKVMAARRNLPASVETVEIDGGNHSQFGAYGFQPGDWPATISREEQRRRTVEAVVAMLARVTSSAALMPRRIQGYTPNHLQ